MRYREGAEPGAPVTEDAFIATAVLGLLLGAVFVAAGLRGRQIGLAFWGGGLCLASVAYLVAIALGY